MTTILVRRFPGNEDLPLPRRATEGASGFDLHAAVREEVVIPPGGRALIPAGIALAIPPGFEAQVRPRSGLALRHGVTVLNAPGTIDSDYRGEVGVILANFGPEPFVVRRGDRIAQLVFVALPAAELIPADELPDSARGSGGFGSTGGRNGPMNTEALQKAFETLVRQAYDIAASSFQERRDSTGLLIITAQRDYILSFNLRTFLRPALIPAFSALLHALHVVLERNRTPEEGIFVLNELHEAVENFARLAWLNPPPPQSPKGGGDGAVR